MLENKTASDMKMELAVLKALLGPACRFTCRRHAGRLEPTQFSNSAWRRWFYPLAKCKEQKSQSLDWLISSPLLASRQGGINFSPKFF